MSLEGYSSVNASEAYHRAYNLGMESGQTSCLITPLWGLWAFHITRGDPSPARAYAAQTQKIADAVGDPALLVEACYATGITALHGGELEAAKAHFSRGLTIYESATNKIEFLLYLFDPGVACRLHLARTLWQMGFPDTALDQAQRALRRAESLGHPQTIAYALVFTSLVHLLRREAFPGEQYALAAITLSDTHGFPQERVWATGLYGWSLALRERASEGVDLIVGVCKIQEQNGSRIAGTQFAAILAEALSLAGDFSSAIQVLDEGLAQAEQILEHYYQAELYRLKGEYLGKVTRGEGDLVKADECLTLAATLARQQGARLLELRALRSKAQLWIDNGNKHALNVADDLRALYSRFTEGHQTLDLAESYAVIRRFVAFGATPRTIGDSCEHEGS